MHAHAIKKRSYRREGRTPNQPLWTATHQGTAGSARVISSRLIGLDSELVLDSREVARKLWHITPGALILGLPLVRNYEPFASHLSALIVLFTAALFVLSLVYAKSFIRPGEKSWVTSVWAYAAMVLVPLIVFPGQVELALTTLVILAFGDGAAALGGLALRGSALPWNEKKTIAGTLSFILCAAPCAVWIYWGIASPPVPWELALISGIAASAVAAVAESIPSSINDNLRVGTAATLMLLLLRWTMLGA